MGTVDTQMKDGKEQFFRRGRSTPGTTDRGRVNSTKPSEGLRRVVKAQAASHCPQTKGEERRLIKGETPKGGNRD